MLLKIHPETPQERYLDQVIDVLRSGGVIIYPTDTMYGLGCDISSKKAVDRICQIKGIDPEKTHLSCVCEDISIIGSYASRVDDTVFKIMKRALPGPYTFILEASKKIPRHFKRKKTIGIRVPDHPIPIVLARLLGNPIASISLPQNEEQAEFNMDPELIHEHFANQVDLVIDGGYGNLEASTVIDCSQGADDITVVREGAGPLEKLGLMMG
jgi:tRNA threonylcarbamoyl adenosine modification protein (Sua5/YciO/YrdC/YwlC family)